MKPKDSSGEEKTPRDKAKQERFEKRWGSGKVKGPQPQGGKDPRKR